VCAAERRREDLEQQPPVPRDRVDAAAGRISRCSFCLMSPRISLRLRCGPVPGLLSFSVAQRTREIGVRSHGYRLHPRRAEQSSFLSIGLNVCGPILASNPGVNSRER